MNFFEDRPFVPDDDYAGQEFIAYPCCGSSRWGTGHTNEVARRDGETIIIIGFVPLQKAIDFYGADNLFVSESSCICPLCAIVFELEIETKIKHKLVDTLAKRAYR